MNINDAETEVPFFGYFVSLKTINDNPLYYSFMLSQELLGYSFDTTETMFIESFFTKTENVHCDICHNEEIDLDFVKHCRGGYHMSCLKDWLRTNASCPHCHKDCDEFDAVAKSPDEEKEDN